MSKYIWRYITRKEYTCDCCGRLPPAFYFEDGREVYSPPEAYVGFFELFEEIRGNWGQSIPISSGYRCPEHNRDIGGELMSVHQTGLALDLDLPSVEEVDRLSYMIEQKGYEIRMGIYRKTGSFIHIDQGFKVRPILDTDWYSGKRWWR